MIKARVHSLAQRLGRWLSSGEAWLASTVLLVIAILPVAEALMRWLGGTGIAGSGQIVRHLTLWIAFLGAALAAKEGRLLALATPQLIPRGRVRKLVELVATTLGVAVTALLARAGFEFLQIEREFGDLVVPGLPVWVTLLILPFGFALIAGRLVLVTQDWGSRLFACGGLLAGLWLGQRAELLDSQPAWPFLVSIAVATVCGMPLFAALGGAALFLFMIDGVPIAAVPVETYRLAVSPTLPAIPLFTLTGFLLAEGRASNRLIAVFRGFFGWAPGGTAIVAAVVCAFFTVFTGGSGVTILALGGLLFKALLEDRYRERFALGLLTASGSLGLLLPPALPLILYGIVAQVPITDLFVGGILPGLLLIGLIAAWGLREGLRGGSERTPFDLRSALRATWVARWELLLPIVLLAAIFSGFATIVEASAVSVIYVLVLQTLVHRDIPSLTELGRVLRQCSVLIGGVLIILCVAMGLTNYLVDAQIPTRAVDWVQTYVHSPLVFLLVLNVFLLLVGCLMDIFSATVVVVPLIVPLGVAFGIDPIHLGIIFIANLELGYLTPPVGLNLFLASYRFDRPLLAVYRAALPMLAILGIGVLLITYVPWLSTGILGLLGR